MRYLDIVELATTTTDGYGDKTVAVLSDVNALLVRRTAVNHNTNADGITSDAAVYLDPLNEIVAAKMNELEGMYILAYGAWYRILHVTIGQRKLLDNAIDNIYCLLEKEPGAPYVTYVS